MTLLGCWTPRHTQELTFLGNKKVELSDVILKNQFITGKFIIKRNKKMKILEEKYPKKKPFIIAEISANHNNSTTRTFKLIKEAKKVGAHAIKLQTYDADSMTLNSNNKYFKITDKKSLWHKKNLYNLYKKAALPYSWYKDIFKEAKKNNIICFSTPFDEKAVDYLNSFDVPAYKIASFENNHIPLLEKVIKKKKPIIISLGATTKK